MIKPEIETAQDKFFADANQDGRADGLEFLARDYDKRMRGLEAKFILWYFLTGLGVILTALIADYVGHLLGWH